MSNPWVIGVVIGLWLIVFLFVLAACWAAGRGDAALVSEAPPGPLAEERVSGPTPPRVRAPARSLARRPRLH